MHHQWETLATGVRRCRLPFLDVSVGLVVGDRHALIVDCGTTLVEAEAIRSDVQQIAHRAVSRILLTHHHFDHVLGVGAFPGAEVYAAPAVAWTLASGLTELRSQAIGYGADAADIDRAIAAVRQPDHQILRAELELGGRTVHVEHVGKAHTDHDLVAVIRPVVEGDRVVVFCGDLIEESADPSVDAESDLAAWPDALDRLLALGGPDSIYIPGHGAAVTAEFIVRQRDWLLARLSR